MKFLKRPWYEIVGWLVWLAVEIMFLQTAIASSTELAPRAALISWIFFIVIFAAGAALFIRQSRKA